MEGFIALAILIIVLQLALSVFQIRYYDNFVRNLAAKYQGTEGYSLDSDQAKNLFQAAIVVLISDSNNRIIEAYEYKGLSIFARFQPIESLIGVVINQDLFNCLQETELTLANKALIKLVERKL